MRIDLEVLSSFGLITTEPVRERANAEEARGCQRKAKAVRVSQSACVMESNRVSVAPAAVLK